MKLFIIFVALTALSALASDAQTNATSAPDEPDPNVYGQSNTLILPSIASHRLNFTRDIEPVIGATMAALFRLETLLHATQFNLNDINPTELPAIAGFSEQCQYILKTQNENITQLRASIKHLQDGGIVFTDHSRHVFFLNKLK